MRRFDKKNVIKEANEKLEKEFIKSLNEQEEGSAPTEEKKEKDNVQEDFEKAKKELNISGNDKEASGVLLGGNGKRIRIKNDGTFSILTKNAEPIKSGKYKSVGIFPNKHIEYSIDDGKNFYKLKNLLPTIEKEMDSDKPSFLNIFKTIVKTPNNFSKYEYDEKSYIYDFHTTKSGLKWSIRLTPNDDGDTGSFNLFFTKSNEKPTLLKIDKTLIGGDFTDYGKVLTLNNPIKDFGVDKNNKIDSALIEMVKTLNPKWI